MSRTQGNKDISDNLRWGVFVTPGIPIVTRDKPPGVRETFFQATASTLIYGVRDAVLVDAFMAVKQANALADWVAARGKNLTTIYITHGHGDHWFGVGTLLERFPHAKAVAMPNAVKVMRQNASPEALEGAWKVGFPGQIPDRLVIAEEPEGMSFISKGMNWSPWNLVIPTRTTRPVCMSLRLASSWLATLFTMTSTSTSLNLVRRHDASGSTRWTRLRR